MNFRTRTKTLLFSLLAALLAIGITGCGAPSEEDILADMKEFVSPDGSASLSLNKDWITDEVPNMEQWLLATNKNDTQELIMMQFPKAIYSGAVSSIDDMDGLIRQSFTVSEEEAMDAPNIPGMDNISAYQCKMSDGSTSGTAFLVYGETDYAYYAIASITTKVTDTFKTSFRLTCESFKENAPEIENKSTVEVTDTIRWFNGTYAVLTAVNQWDYNLFGGLPANDASAEIAVNLLDEWWDVTDRASAEENLTWILEEGHRAEFASLMTQLEEEGIKDAAAGERESYLLENYDMTEDEAALFAKCYGFYEEFGPAAIDGWDYGRAMSLLGYYYLAGYYSETEALDKALEISKTIQSGFGSWDELIASYMRGYEYWAEESSEERQAIYEDLKTKDDSPFKLDWNLSLEKTW